MRRTLPSLLLLLLTTSADGNSLELCSKSDKVYAAKRCRNERVSFDSLATILERSCLESTAKDGVDGGKGKPGAPGEQGAPGQTGLRGHSLFSEIPSGSLLSGSIAGVADFKPSAGIDYFKTLASFTSLLQRPISDSDIVIIKICVGYQANATELWFFAEETPPRTLRVLLRRRERTKSCSPVLRPTLDFTACKPAGL